MNIEKLLLKHPSWRRLNTGILKTLKQKPEWIGYIDEPTREEIDVCVEELFRRLENSLDIHN